MGNHPLKRNSLAVVIFLLLTFLMTFPWGARLATSVQASSDSYFNIWTIAWDVHMFQENPTDIFNANIFYPNKNTLAYSENLIGSALFAWPVIALSGNPVLAYNIIIFIFFVLAGYCMYLLAYYFTKNFPVSILGGIIYGFNAYMFLHFNLLHIMAVFFFPLIFLIMHKLVESEKRKYFAYFIVTFTLLGYMSMHFFMMLLLFIPVYLLVYYGVIKRKMPSKKIIVNFVISFIISTIIILPVFYPYLTLRTNIEYDRSYAMVNQFSPTVTDYLTFSPMLMGLFELPKNIFKTYIYSGFTVLFLVIFSIIMLIKKYYRQKEIINISSLYIIIGFVAFIMSFGVVIRFSENDPGVVGPFMLLFEFVPGFSSLRALGRFSIVILLSMSVIITIILNQYMTRFKKKFVYVGMLLIISCLVILEYMIIPPLKPVNLETVKTGSNIPEVYRWLSEQKDDTVILELPIWVNGMEETAKYQYYSAFHWHRQMHGYSGYYPPEYRKIFIKPLKDLLNDDTIKEIRAVGVDYIILHTGASMEFAKELREADVKNNQNLQLIEIFGSDWVYQIK
ncbi:MAG: hypothetical protein WC693_05445 [Patescibacteria group bacterium]|jgi:hypothetical protein